MSITSNVTSDNHIITVNGKGRVTTVPDIAVLRLGVQTLGMNLTQVQAENAKISQAVLQAIKQLGITDIKTYQYTINKVYEYQDGKQVDKGYSVQNVFEIRLANMDQTGAVIDAAVKKGANIVNFIGFEVSNSNAYYLEALDLAVKSAHQKANLIAESLGITDKPIPFRVVENSSSPVSYDNSAKRAESYSPATPVESGTMQVEASVAIEFIF